MAVRESSSLMIISSPEQKFMAAELYFVIFTLSFLHNFNPAVMVFLLFVIPDSNQ